ncbi:MAG TPA: DUF3226 domain-containing protein [Gemmataceae bacterium]|nr:DUF3226 domain-containing protein [Gemmataceae bacterium]
MPAKPARPQIIMKPRLLAGEGDDEVAFFGALLAYLNIDDIQVEQYGGKQNLSRYVRELRNRPGYERVVALGLTRDADTDCTAAFDHVRGALTGNQFPAPGPLRRILDGTPRIGVFILPGNSRPGMLEDLCMDSVDGDPALACLTTYFECVLRAAGRQPGNQAKARVHAWLASQTEPDRRLGEAAAKGYWPWDNSAFNALRDFLRML